MRESASGEADSSTDSGDKDSSVECRICGDVFNNNLGLSTHFRYKHDDPSWMPEEGLRRLYREERMSQREIADYYDTSKLPVQRALKAYGIEQRKSNRDKVPAHDFRKFSDSVGHEYERVRARNGDTRATVLIHRLVAVAEGELPTEEFGNDNLVVHHKSKHGLDNRPSNLEVMTQREHGTHHAEDRHGDSDISHAP
jgi:hypothetical protein